jgi:hypothetical protein
MPLPVTRRSRVLASSALRLAIAVPLGFAALTASPAVAQSDGQARSQSPSAVINPSHIGAEELAILLREVVDSSVSVGDVKRAPGPGGGLFFTIEAPVSRLAAIERLVERLDVPSNQARSAMRIEFYDLSELADGNVGQQTLAALVDGRSRDALWFVSASGLATVFADGPTHTAVAEAFTRLKAMSADVADREAAPAATKDAPSADRLVRLTWLVTSPSDAPEPMGRPVAQDMRSVVTQLEGLGLSGWREFGRSSVLTSPTRPFSLRTAFQPSNAGDWSLDWSGTIMSGEAGRTRVMSKTRLIEESGAAMIELENTLELAAGKRVVLGLTPVLDMHAVLVLELFEPGPA